MILLTAATISGVNPAATAANRGAGCGVAATSSSQSRSPPTVRCEISWKAAGIRTGRAACELVTRAQWSRLGEQIDKPVEAVIGSGDLLPIAGRDHPPA